MSVFRNLDCLSLVVCSNTTLLKLQTVLLLFFSKFCASKSGVRLIHACGLSMHAAYTWTFMVYISKYQCQYHNIKFGVMQSHTTKLNQIRMNL